MGGIKEGDFIVEISGIDVKWYTHQQIVSLIQSVGNSLELKVITPMDRNYLKVSFFNFLIQKFRLIFVFFLQPLTASSKGSISTLSGGSSSGVSSGAPSPTGTTSSKTPKSRGKLSKNRLSSITSSNWNPFKRSQSLGKIF